MSEKQLEIRCLSKTYTSGAKVIDNLSLTVNAGEIFFLVGPSGCGKSTLLRTVSGLLAPDAGKIAIAGRDVTTLAPEARRTAMVFQNYALWPHLSVAENVGFAPKIAGKTKAEVAATVESALKSVRLEEFSNRRIHSLSGGQQQRVALARALAAEPELLLLDEPLSNLDAKLRDAMRLEIRRILREKKLTALYVTHDRREAMSIADRIAVLRDGKIKQSGSPRELYLHPCNRFVAGFLGDADFLDGTADSDGTFATAAGKISASEIRERGTRATLLLRPELWSLASAPGRNTFPAVCREAVYLGEKFECRMAIGNTEVTVALPPGTTPVPEPGAEYRLHAEPSAIALLKD